MIPPTQATLTTRAAREALRFFRKLSLGPPEASSFIVIKRGDTGIFLEYLLVTLPPHRRVPSHSPQNAAQKNAVCTRGRSYYLIEGPPDQLWQLRILHDRLNLHIDNGPIPFKARPSEGSLCLLGPFRPEPWLTLMIVRNRDVDQPPKKRDRPSKPPPRLFRSG